ncbi:uncharacterized protein UV8b_05542 [Ustilaginoidea virens]|uniref:Uncharacterized protein n=1 Tax=Ustilaginoidea virens TaxID=1159556 RepID=A0A8E5HU58_USTVR|nr:uncharacterized protein UV8b_05542 [Ustilaginoidea virens]QUC21299.1 hypothetical protein UV8b_05542 [Ustilaginoidea virens]
MPSVIIMLVTRADVSAPGASASFMMILVAATKERLEQAMMGADKREEIEADDVGHVWGGPTYELVGPIRAATSGAIRAQIQGLGPRAPEARR